MKLTVVLCLSLCVIACNNTEDNAESDAANTLNPVAPTIPVVYNNRSLANTAAYIPSQCYTKTEDANGNAHNPCYVCHTSAMRPNYINDLDLQLNYAFAEEPRTNRWLNLFKDRIAAVDAISDASIKAYIRQSNYFERDGSLALAGKLASMPDDWDFNSNGQWDGFVPDAWFDFDEEGFDRDQHGNDTGWRAYAYYPFPGTFWPTNGSTNDVLIRLPDVSQQNMKGEYDRTVYKINLAIVEAMIREQDIAVEPVDEAAIGGVDINKDGEIAIANKIAYDWVPLKKRFMWYVGKAHVLQQRGEVQIAAGLFPQGTEFLHTVRYIDVADNGDIQLAARIKEVRYARKRTWLTYSDLKENAHGEFKEKRDFPDRLRTVLGNHEVGVSNGQGWTYAAFIEDASGELRPQTYEELVFCVGCHSGIGATRDGIFSFERRLAADGYQQGWFHWSQKSIKGLKDPLRKDGRREYAFYLENNHAGDEFRNNAEIIEKFFSDDGVLKQTRLEAMSDDISELLWPSASRAMLLNKAYSVIVREQSYLHGRDATVKPPENVHDRVEEGQPTGITAPVVAEKLSLL